MEKEWKNLSHAGELAAQAGYSDKHGELSGKELVLTTKHLSLVTIT